MPVDFVFCSTAVRRLRDYALKLISQSLYALWKYPAVVKDSYSDVYAVLQRAAGIIMYLHMRPRHLTSAMNSRLGWCR